MVEGVPLETVTSAIVCFHIQFAYRDNQQFIGGPDWLDSDRWDIEAKAPQGTVPPRSSAFNIAAPDTLAFMVQSLLEERFQLKAHRETRELWKNNWG